jgi:hypothetical protein
MASATAWTSFEEKPGKLPDFFRKIIVARDCCAWLTLPTLRERTLSAVPPRRKRHFGIETGLQKLATNASGEVA